MNKGNDLIIWFDDEQCRDIARVGGKNASLGELTSRLRKDGIAIPDGFASNTSMYQDFVEHNSLAGLIHSSMEALKTRQLSLAEAGTNIREAFLKSAWPTKAKNALTAAYSELNQRHGMKNMAVAVRSSATAEDLPEASFAGQQESYLNIQGEDELLAACRRCYASLFTDRAISYRALHNIDHLAVTLSLGVQRMVRADLGCSGVLFTLDTETGFDQVINIAGVWGLGENIVQGIVDPDEYMVFKPLLDHKHVLPIIDRHLGGKAKKMIYRRGTASPTRNVKTTAMERNTFVLEDEAVLTLARWAVIIERHYACPMDIEWARDGESGKLFIVQARPETVQSRRAFKRLQSYHITSRNKPILKGQAVGQSIVSAPVCIIRSAEDIGKFVDGSILVTENTDPDWVPIMKRAVAIITDHGGRTSHAAIVSRELGLPAILGTMNATEILKNKQLVSVSCAEGDTGMVYEGKVDFSMEEFDLQKIPDTTTEVMLNLANPATAFKWWPVPSDGIGLVRMEFVINNHVKVHPLALVHFNELKDRKVKTDISRLTREYEDKTGYFVDKLALGLARFAALAYPKPCIIRMSDFKTNEYAHLLGGADFEPEEENPMLGFRGASRYYADAYQPAFALECRAIKKLRETTGFDNVIVMIPFCRTIEEAEKVLQVMADHGLERHKNKLQVYVMCEIPANVILAKKFAQYFDGFSIGSNDLTQLTLGVDRDSSELAALFSEQDEAVKWMISHAIKEAHAGGAKIGLCGQAPSDHPEFSAFLVQCGIDSISVSPDSFLAVKQHIAAAEKSSIVNPGS